MKVFITGGTGFIGSSLTKRLTQSGFQVTVLTRRAGRGHLVQENLRMVEGDPSQPGPWQEKLTESDVVVNLAGASIFQRWNAKNKRIIRESRRATTRNIIAAMSRKKGSKIDLINGSAVGFYGHRGDEQCDENQAPGSDFLASVAQEWEAEALKAIAFGARVVICRFGIVLGSHGGALGKMAPVFRFGIGSRIASGLQWFSWIHEDDLVRILQFLLQSRKVEGAVNCTAPYPVQNKDFTRALARAVKRPRILPPLPGFILRIALGEFSETLLKGQRVIPRILLEKGFPFKFPDIESALCDLVTERNGQR